MKKYLIATAVGLTGALFLTLTAQGATIPTINLANYGVGYIDPTIIPPTGVTPTILGNMIGVYNGTLTSPIDGEDYTKDQGSSTPNPNLPSGPATLFKTSVSGSPTSFNINLGAGGDGNYLIAQWDGGNGADAVYYIAGLTGEVTLVNDLPGTFINPSGHTQLKSQLGLSDFWLQDAPPSVPDAASTALLLGAALSGLGLLRRKLS